MKRGWVLTKKGKRTYERAKKKLPKVIKLVTGDYALFSLAVASGSFKQDKNGKLVMP
jgi:ribosome biogenesis GTPase A